MIGDRQYHTLCARMGTTLQVNSQQKLDPETPSSIPQAKEPRKYERHNSNLVHSSKIASLKLLNKVDDFIINDCGWVREVAFDEMK